MKIDNKKENSLRFKLGEILMIKNYWLSIVILASSYSSTLKADVYTTLKHPEYNQTLTIIAELGVGDKLTKNVSKELSKKIKNASQILVESELGNTEIPKRFSKIALKGYPEQLKEQTTPSTWKRINLWLKNKKNEPGSHLITNVPSHWSLVLIGNIILRDKKQFTITQYLSTLPHETTAIFNAEEQHNWFMNFNKKAIDSLLNQAINENNQFHNQLIKSWKNNDVKTLKKITNKITSSDNGDYIQHNYDALNEKIVQRLQLLGSGDHVIALNIVSYMGENNIIDRLITQGYQRQSIKKNQTKRG